MGGVYFQFFTKNRPQNHQNGAILHTSQANGGARAPCPPWLRYWMYCITSNLLEASEKPEKLSSFVTISEANVRS